MILNLWSSFPGSRNDTVDEFRTKLRRSMVPLKSGTDFESGSYKPPFKGFSIENEILKGLVNSLSYLLNLILIGCSEYNLLVIIS